MRNMVYLVTIKSLDLIEGKDRIVYAHFEENGYGVICGKDFKVGEKAVYFEVDSILPEIEAYESFRSRCYKASLNGFLIRNMKMFKLYSNGMIMHQNEVPVFDNKAKTVEELKDSEKKGFLMKHACTRWLGRALFFAKKASGDFPSYLIAKSDEDNIQNAPGRFGKYKTDKCYVTIKMEGQSMTVLNVPDKNKLGKFMVFGRNCAGNESLWKFAEKEEMERKHKYAYKKTHHIFAVQGEHVSNSVQSGIYKNGEHFYVYLVKDLTDMKPLSATDMYTFCKTYGFETVPFVICGKTLEEAFKNVDDMQEYVEHQWFNVTGDNHVDKLDDRFDKLPNGDKYEKPK